MEITTHMQQDTYEVVLRGKFTFSDHSEFRSILDKFSDDKVKNIVFRMAEVDFVDSAALGMLLLALDESEKQHKTLTLSGATGQVKKMFDMARFNTLFNVS